MARITVLDSGTYYHHRTIHEPRYRAHFDEIVYIRDLPRTDLSDHDLLLVSCRTDPSQLIPCKAQFADYLAGGGTVVALVPGHVLAARDHAVEHEVERRRVPAARTVRREERRRRVRVARVREGGAEGSGRHRHVRAGSARVTRAFVGRLCGLQLLALPAAL